MKIKENHTRCNKVFKALRVKAGMTHVEAIKTLEVVKEDFQYHVTNKNTEEWAWVKGCCNAHRRAAFLFL